MERKIITDITVTSNKNFSDIVWNYLQRISEVDGRILKSDCAYNKVGKELEIDRRKISAIFKFLEDVELITSEQNYWKIENPAEYEEVEAGVVDVLEGARMEGVITEYGFLKKLWGVNGEKRFIVRVSALKDRIGITNNTRSNNGKITELLDVLRYNGLIDGELKVESNKSNWWINNVGEKIVKRLVF